LPDAQAPTRPITEMGPGTFTIRRNLPPAQPSKTSIAIDVVIQPKSPERSGRPILIEARSSRDFLTPIRHHRRDAARISRLRLAYGDDIDFVLFLCGYFDGSFLGYTAAEGIDWVWEHRISDFDQLVN